MCEKSHWFHAIDASLGILLFLPAKLIYLRGTWDILGVYLYPGQTPKGEWVMMGIGFVGAIVIGYFLSPLLAKFFSANLGDVAYLVLTRFTLYIQAAINIAFMRGVWDLAEYYLGPYGWQCRLGVFLGSYFVLILLRTSRSCITMPFFIQLDFLSSILIPSTRFGVKVDRRSGKLIALYALDSIFTQVVIITLVCLVWRSYLTLLQEVIYPQTPSFSAGLCVLVGVISCSLWLCAEVPLSKLGDKIEKKNRYFAKFAFENVLFFVVFLCQGMLWGGAWRLDKMYIIPDPEIGGWIHHAIGTFLLIVLHVFNSTIAGVGCTVDGGNLAVVIYQTKYLRSIKSFLDRKKQSAMTPENKEILFRTSASLHSLTDASTVQNGSTQAINPSSL